jgi:hypothetical protein
MLNGDHQVSNEESLGAFVWGWDGSTWRLMMRDAPPAKSLGGVVYDETRHQLVVYGGNTATGCEREMWIHMTTWTRLDGPFPTACDHLAMSNDPSAVAMLFGGQTTPAEGYRPLNETWTWDGMAWSKAAESGPPARIHHAMAFDPVRKRVVLFGGRGGAESLNDTWEWDGSTWRGFTAASPSARDGMRMAFDPVSGSVLLFGGTTSSFDALGDTWAWNGSTWTHLATDGPPARGYHAMAPDPVRKRVVLFGGSAGNTIFDDTWEWNGTSWSCLAGCP